MTDSNQRVSRLTYAGLFLTALSTLALEILLTRVFSVTLVYHFAFVAVSLALLGMTVGALVIYQRADFFSGTRVKPALALNAVMFAFSTVVVCSVAFLTPQVLWPNMAAQISVLFLILGIPFFFSGMVISLVLTKFPRNVGSLYAADLIGAALGSFLFVFLLKAVSGPTAVFVIAATAAAGALLFAFDARRLYSIALSSILFGFLVYAVIIGYSTERNGLPLFHITGAKGQAEDALIYEKWNAFSRIAVHAPAGQGSVFGWGFGAMTPKERVLSDELYLNIDADAGTVLTKFDGELSAVEYLRADIVNTAHILRRDADVLVIGAGGGRDILSALLFRQRSVTAVEMNDDIIGLLKGRYAGFTGNLGSRPDVFLVNDEARSYAARTDKKFDIIQASLIDTWAATAAGALALTESALYTTEGWQTFLSRLTDRGILTFSRWYRSELPGEIYRMVSLATESLRRIGVTDVAAHIIVVAKGQAAEKGKSYSAGIGTILVSRSPFSMEDKVAIEVAARTRGFSLMLVPGVESSDPLLSVLSRGGNAAHAAAKSLSIDVSAPTDNWPFFFQMLRPSGLLTRSFFLHERNGINNQGVIVIVGLLLFVSLLTVITIIFPFTLFRQRNVLRGSFPLLAFFLSIGFGYLFVEIALMQRLTIVLGHPVYSLSVSLFTLLLSSGIGSFLVRRAPGDVAGVPFIAYARMRLLLIIALLTVTGIVLPFITSAAMPLSTLMRIAVAVAVLFPVGVGMGMAFPLGMRIAGDKFPALSPWFWGVNGIASVCSSVAAAAISLFYGVSATFWVGAVCYLCAYLSFRWWVLRQVG